MLIQPPQAFWRSSWLKSVAFWMRLRYRNDRLKSERKHGHYRRESKQPVAKLFSITVAKSDIFSSYWMSEIKYFFLFLFPSPQKMYQDNGVRPITAGWWDFCVPGYCLTLPCLLMDVGYCFKLDLTARPRKIYVWHTTPAVIHCSPFSWPAENGEQWMAAGGVCHAQSHSAF